MKVLLLRLTACVFILSGVVNGRGEERSAVTASSEGRLQPQKSVPAKMDYLLFLPQGYEKSDRKWPVLLYLHGAGECGTNLNLLKRNGPTKYVRTHPEFPFILVAPQTKGGF